MMTFGGGRPWLEDNLPWKTTFSGRQSSCKYASTHVCMLPSPMYDNSYLWTTTCLVSWKKCFVSCSMLYCYVCSLLSNLLQVSSRTPGGLPCIDLSLINKKMKEALNPFHAIRCFDIKTCKVGNHGWKWEVQKYALLKERIRRRLKSWEKLGICKQVVKKIEK